MKQLRTIKDFAGAAHARGHDGRHHPGRPARRVDGVVQKYNGKGYDTVDEFK